jgi:hypothetical protein
MSDFILIEREPFVRTLSIIDEQETLDALCLKTTVLREQVARQADGMPTSLPEEDCVPLKRETLLKELDQIREAHTLERARYYLQRLRKSVQELRVNRLNDINLARWKEYEHVLTDSLWLMPKRDSSGAHLAWYWGNFIPQIPHQMLLRYTKQGDWVLDPFVGSGTTLIECRRLGRNGIGIELLPEIAEQAGKLIESEPNPHAIQTPIVNADSRTINWRKILHTHSVQQCQLVILHPPYHDVVPFSDNPNDLSNAQDVDMFLSMFREVVANVSPVLEKGRMLVLVIGDKYQRGEWIPLGFQCMQRVLEHGYTLKSIVVKNFDQTRGKRSRQALWRYRALVGGFYVFKHEYVMVFEKR